MDIEYIPENSTVLLEGNSYIVFIDVIIDEELASYVLHCEGNPREILKAWLRGKHKVRSTIYYKLQQEKIFRNHSEKVVANNGETLYKYIGEV